MSSFSKQVFAPESQGFIIKMFPLTKYRDFVSIITELSQHIVGLSESGLLAGSVTVKK